MLEGVRFEEIPRRNVGIYEKTLDEFIKSDLDAIKVSPDGLTPKGLRGNLDRVIRKSGADAQTLIRKGTVFLVRASRWRKHNGQG